MICKEHIRASEGALQIFFGDLSPLAIVGVGLGGCECGCAPYVLTCTHMHAHVHTCVMLKIYICLTSVMRAKMQCPLNLVLESWKYLWFYLTFWIANFRLWFETP